MSSRRRDERIGGADYWTGVLERFAAREACERRVVVADGDARRLFDHASSLREVADTCAAPELADRLRADADAEDDLAVLASDEAAVHRAHLRRGGDLRVTCGVTP